MATALSPSDFIDLFTKLGATKTAQMVGLSERQVYARRARLQTKMGRTISAPSRQGQSTVANYTVRTELKLKDGIVLVGSDAHYWPGEPSAAHRAYVKFCKDLKPNIVILNGDVLDGASISRHPPIGWESRPSLIEEIEAVKLRTGEIRKALAGSKTKLIWTLGNHDGRFETRLATVAPEYARVHGVHLKDHFPEWTPAWSAWINDKIVIKHRYNSGVHATHNNTVKSGKSIATGHLHSLKVTPYTDYNGTRFGIDTGTLAVPAGPQFVDYCEDNPVNWRSGFILLTFKNYELLWPEIIHVRNERAGEVEFRGKVYKV